MKKICALIVCMTGCSAALFTQTEADFDTEVLENGVMITRYKGKGGAVVIPASIGGKAVTGIGENAFAGVKSLRSVTIPEGLTSIEQWAFGNSGLTSITIPEGVTSIGGGAFDGCSGLRAISVSQANQQYQDREGVLFTKDGKTFHTYPAGGKTAYAIPDGVTAIGMNAFANCSRLSSVTIPESVTTIGIYAFEGCSGLKPEVRADIEKRFGSSVF